MHEENISRRKFIEKSGKALLTTSSFSVILSCSKKSGTGSDSAICFTVGGFVVTVHNMWSDGSAYSVNVQGRISFNREVTRNNETHTLEWTNINNNYNINAVTSFDVKIDGRDYSYPADECDSNFDDGY